MCGKIYRARCGDGKGRKAGSGLGGCGRGSVLFFFSSRRRHTRLQGDWSSDVCSSDLHGLLRLNEREQVERTFRAHLGIELRLVHAGARFLEALAGIEDPEEKRRRIGHTFIDVFEAAAEDVPGDVGFLVQGTLYPDVIESSSPFGGPSVTIKTHHNVGGLRPDLRWKLSEPLRELFKDEVRQVGRELGLPEEIVGRHPFPGPGLAIRVIGPVTEERLDVLRRVDAIYIAEIRGAGLYDQIWQAFAVLLPIKSVGVMGDGRTYEHVVALRAVTSRDGMTADWFGGRKGAG